MWRLNWESSLLGNSFGNRHGYAAICLSAYVESWMVETYNIFRSYFFCDSLVADWLKCCVRIYAQVVYAKITWSCNILSGTCDSSMILKKCLDNWIFYCAKSPLKGIPMSDWRAGVIPVRHGWRRILAAAGKCELRSLACAPPPPYFSGRLEGQCWWRSSSDPAPLCSTPAGDTAVPDASEFVESFPRNTTHGQKVAYEIRCCAKWTTNFRRK